MDNKSIKNSSKKISAKELFSRPKFYLALLPHVISLFFVITGSLSYFLVFLIFFIELIIDNVLMCLSIILMRNEHVKKVYKSRRSKYFLAFRTLMSGLFLCIFFGVFAFIIFGQDLSPAIVNNRAVIWILGIYLVSQIIKLITNAYRYRTGQQPYIDKGVSFLIGIIVLILLVPGWPIIMILSFFLGNMSLIGIVVIFAVRGYLDAALTSQAKEIEDDFMSVYREEK